MPNQLLIINLEDNANDAELIAATLDSAGIACEIRRVETQADFLAAIGQDCVDLILADYSLPAFDGLSALVLAGERGPDVPFIFVTGTMGEEIAVEALKHGATDYVLKQNLARLAPVVRRALREAEDRRARKRAEEQIKAALAEKETLLRELYHRTKNNMQVIRSMLVLQAAHYPDLPLSAFVHAIEQKIYTMALVHEKLYQSQDLSRIDLQEYLADLTALVLHNDRGAVNHIALRWEDREHVPVLLDTAIPCGLIVNELLSNAVQHAFPDGRPGEIRIGLRRDATGRIELYLADNGVGVPPGFDFRGQSTLGFQTIVALAEHQLQGTVQFEVQHGLACTLRFTDNLYTPRV